MISFLHALAAALRPFHQLDPTGWFAWRDLLRPGTALLLVAIGLFCLAMGARQGVFRFVAVPIAALVGLALTAPALAITHGTAIPDRAVELILPLGMGLLAGFVPHTVAFFALGSVGALVGSSLVSEHEVLVGAIPGFFLAGVLGIVFAGVIDPIASAAFGALLAVGGLWRAFPHGPLAHVLESASWAPAIVALGLTAAGAAVQLVLWSNPQARSERRAEAREKKQRAQEDRARAARFADYAKRG